MQTDFFFVSFAISFTKYNKMLKNVDKYGLQTSFFHRKVRHLQQYILG